MCFLSNIRFTGKLNVNKLFTNIKTIYHSSVQIHSFSSMSDASKVKTSVKEKKLNSVQPLLHILEQMKKSEPSKETEQRIIRILQSSAALTQLLDLRTTLPLLYPNVVDATGVYKADPRVNVIGLNFQKTLGYISPLTSVLIKSTSFLRSLYAITKLNSTSPIAKNEFTINPVPENVLVKTFLPLRERRRYSRGLAFKTGIGHGQRSTGTPIDSRARIFTKTENRFPHHRFLKHLSTS